MDPTKTLQQQIEQAIDNDLERWKEDKEREPEQVEFFEERE